MFQMETNLIKSVNRETYTAAALYNCNLGVFNCHLPPTNVDNSLVNLSVCHLETLPPVISDKDIEFGIALGGGNLMYCLDTEKWRKKSSSSSHHLDRKVHSQLLVDQFRELQRSMFPQGNIENIISFRSGLLEVVGMTPTQEFISNNKDLVHLLCPTNGSFFNISVENFTVTYPENSFVHATVSSVKQKWRTNLSNFFTAIQDTGDDNLWGFRFTWGECFDQDLMCWSPDWETEVYTVGGDTREEKIAKFQLEKLKLFDNTVDKLDATCFALVVNESIVSVPSETCRIFTNNSCFDLLDLASNSKFKQYFGKQVMSLFKSSDLVRGFYGGHVDVYSEQFNEYQESLYYTISAKVPTTFVYPFLKFKTFIKVRVRAAAMYFFPEGTFPLNTWVSMTLLAEQCYSDWIGLGPPPKSQYFFVNTLNYPYIGEKVYLQPFKGKYTLVWVVW